jgi:hypothetical protein
MKRNPTVFCPEEILEHIDDQTEVHMTWDEVFALENESLQPSVNPGDQPYIYL